MWKFSVSVFLCLGVVAFGSEDLDKFNAVVDSFNCSKAQFTELKSLINKVVDRPKYTQLGGPLANQGPNYALYKKLQELNGKLWSHCPTAVLQQCSRAEDFRSPSDQRDWPVSKAGELQGKIEGPVNSFGLQIRYGAVKAGYYYSMTSVELKDRVAFDTVADCYFARVQ